MTGRRLRTKRRKRETPSLSGILRLSSKFRKTLSSTPVILASTTTLSTTKLGKRIKKA